MSASSVDGKVAPEDDWTLVSDPKEKKRIQNRVAQRTYRHRMKARLGELQAKLDSHERNNKSISAASSTAATTDNSESYASVDRRLSPSTLSDARHWLRSYLPGSDRLPSSADFHHPHGQHLPASPRGGYEWEAKDPSAAFSLPPYINAPYSPPCSTGPSPPSHGNFSPADQPTETNSQDPRRSSRELGLDSSMREGHSLGPISSYRDPYAAAASVEQTNTSMAPPGHVRNLIRMPHLTPASSRDASHQVDEGSGAGLKSNNLVHNSNMLAVQLPETTAYSLQGLANSAPGSLDAALGPTFPNLIPHHPASASFTQHHQPHHHQGLRQNAEDWSWRARYESSLETINAASRIVSEEFVTGRTKVMRAVSALADARGVGDSSDVVQAMKRAIEEELPHSWAISMAMATQNEPHWSRERQHSALASLLLLKFGGHMPKEQLMPLIDLCLS